MGNKKAIDLLDNLIGMIEDNQSNDYDTALKNAIEALEIQNRHCSNCNHLIIWNGNDRYAECGVNDFVFKQFEVDTRETYCNYWEEVE